MSMLKFDTWVVRSFSLDNIGKINWIEDFVLLLSYNGYIMVPSEQAGWNFQSLFTKSLR